MDWPLSFIGLSLALAGGMTWVAVLRTKMRVLENVATTDPLTGVYNRRHLEQCLWTAVDRRARLGESAALLLIDIDCFKQVNDTFGHSAGDRVLRSVAAIVRSRARRMDALFRTGGEEFALLLTGADLRDATSVAEELRVAIERARLVNTGVSVSIGVSDLDAGHTAESWLHDADVAMYLAKRAGRNRVAARDGHIGSSRHHDDDANHVGIAAPIH